MPFTPSDIDRICVIYADFNIKADLLINLPLYETRFGIAYTERVQSLVAEIETLKGNITLKETQFAQNAVDFNLGSSQLAPGVTVGNLKKVGAIEYYNSDSYSSYVKTLAEMRYQLDELIKELSGLINGKKDTCKRTLIR